MTESLTGRVAIVTGAGSGIGRAAALELAGAGVKVVLAGRNRERLDSVRRDIDSAGGTALAVAADLADIAAGAAIVQAAAEAFGEPDILLSNAGLYFGGDFAGVDVQAMRELLNSNVFGALAMVRAVLPGMIATGRGDVIMTSSVSGTQDIWWEPVYSASKHAVDSFVHTVRRQLRSTGVRLGSVSPGVVLNELWGYTGPDAEQQRADQLAEQAGIRSEDVVEAMMFLLTRPRHVTVRDLVILPSGQEI